MIRRTLIPAALLALALLAVPSLAEAKPRTLKVMTQNLYLGADLVPLVSAKNQNQFEQAEEKVAKTVDETNFPARAKAIARLIDKDHPALIGLQEVALWRKGPKNDPGPATTVVYDFLKSLQGELKARGLNYRAARIQTEADVELPAIQDDRRLTMRDVILQDRDRKGLKITGSNSGHFKTQLEVPLIPKTVQFTRGWAYVKAKFNGVKFRFVDTQLESFCPECRNGQAQELAAKRGPANSSGKVILVGDLNSDVAGRGVDDSGAIDALTKLGFKDTWTQVRGNDPGLTWGHPENLRGSKPFEERIDYVLTKPRLKVKTASIVGTSTADQATGGLWPSDHAGLVVGFKIGK